MDKILSTTHSDGPAENGEDYPTHLTTVLQRYRTVKGPASDASNAKKAQSAPAQNRNVQIATGTICPPLPDANAAARFSTRNDNVKANFDMVKKGDNVLVTKEYADKLKEWNKKAKSSKGKKNALSAMEDMNANHSGMNDVMSIMSSLATNMTNKEDARREESRERLLVRKSEQKLMKKQLSLQAKIADDKMNLEHMQMKGTQMQAKLELMKTYKTEAAEEMAKLKESDGDGYEVACKSYKKVSTLHKNLLTHFVQKAMADSPVRRPIDLTFDDTPSPPKSKRPRRNNDNDDDDIEII